MLNNMQWYQGKAIKRTIEGKYGRSPKTIEWLIAAFLRAQEENVNIKELKQMLLEVSQYDPAAHSTEFRKETLGELGF